MGRVRKVSDRKARKAEGSRKNRKANKNLYRRAEGTGQRRVNHQND